MKKRLYFIFAGENMFHPQYFSRVLQYLPQEEYEVAGVTIANDRYRKGIFYFLRQQWELWGSIGFIFIAVGSIVRSCLDRVRRTSMHSIGGIAQRYHIPLRESLNVNEEQHLNHLKTLDLDIIISSCGHIFKKELLALPRLACINRHSSLLPKYGGVLPIFWAMYHGASSAGVSIHYMVEKIDEGDILAQIVLPLINGNSLFKNYILAFEKSVEATVEALENIGKGVVLRHFDKSERTHFSFPALADIKRFKQHYSSFNWGDIFFYINSARNNFSLRI